MLETYPQIIDFDPEVFDYFREQYVLFFRSIIMKLNRKARAHLCKLDVNLTYPQQDIIPTIYLPVPISPSLLNTQTSWVQEISKKAKKISAVSSASFDKREQESRRYLWKRNLSGRANGTIDPHYGCNIFDEMIDYALNFTYPWGRYCLLVCHDPEVDADSNTHLSWPR